jgi:hypothetical protein
MSERTCAHPGCSCSTEPERMYCARSCATASDRPEEAEGCRCGHVDCLGAAGAEGDEALVQGPSA